MNNRPSQELQPLINLQENSSNFFINFQNKFSKNMMCKSGCSKCCYVDISVFEVEAKLIIEWVMFLTPVKKKEFLATLELPESSEKQNTLGKKSKPCSFLRNDICAIYEVRPTICRTQGLPLQYKVSENKNQVQLAVDVCPLNFTQENSLPERADWLDLDRLNALQSIAENFYQKNKKDAYKMINNLKNKQGRITLRKLNEFLIKALKSESI
ncbi:YkgJ family cysteine cluster protein [Fluviispira multicolorata]|uniref:YkgJ family cysteine cluster protein n=1 Tax=Fluviispira multicolorata TaxID=2654512 RepID=A0A833JCK4_9BACT|nr:YkgJ family cysteine cluster protein [Fluviispira multicolorata]KAB8030612.1 hypothetical protein GCL57_06460 [Fluviispira multicolorata]